MARIWTLSSAAVALLVASSALLPAVASAQTVPTTGDQDDLTVGPPVQAAVKRSLDAAESAYSQAGTPTQQAGGMAGVVAAGSATLDINQILKARADARQALTDALNAEIKVTETRADHLKQSGDTMDAGTLLATVPALQDRLAQLSDDAANDLATKNGAPLQPVSVPRGKGAAAAGVFTAGGTPSGQAAVAGGGVNGTGTGGLEGGGGGPAAVGGVAVPVAVARKVTGKLILVVKDDKPEVALAKLDKECERIRKGDAPSDDELDLPATGVECWLVEKWKDKKPVRVRLATSPETARTLAMLKLKPGVMVSVEGMAQPDSMGKGSLNGEVLTLTAWKVVASAAEKKPAGEHEGE